LTTSKQRIHELTIRQVYYGSSMVVKLNAINGKWWYSVFAWLDNGNADTKFLALKNKYSGEDPEDLIKAANEIVLGIRKIKLGVPIQ